MQTALVWILATLSTLQESPACAPIEIREGRVWTQIAVNGVETDALLDSGAEMSVLDTAFAERIEAQTHGTATARGSGAQTIQARFLPETRLNVAGLQIDGATVAVIDLSDVAERLIGGPLPVIAGREIFDASRLHIDFKAGRLCAIPRDAEPDGVRFDLTERAGIMAFRVEIEGQEVLADFDIGNRGELLLTRHFAQDAGLYDGRAVEAVTGGGLGGEVQRDRLTVERVRIGPFFHEGATADIQEAEPKEAPANIGLGLLSGYDITVDYAERALWLAPLR